MVIGIDALIEAIHTEINRYRESKKEDKDRLKNAFLLIETSLDSSLIKINLCKEHGYHMPKKLQLCIPDIALEINEVAKATKDTFPREIYDGLINLANQFVIFNEEINSLSIGKDPQPNLNKLVENIDKLKYLLKDIDNKK